MSFPRYPEYKDSGIKWLGDVPTHWRVSSLKFGYKVTLGKMLQPDQKDQGDIYAPYLRAANIQPSGVSVGDVRSMWFSARERHTLRLRYGDLVVSEGGDVGRSALWKDQLSECYFQNSINRVRAIKSNDIRYLGYWLVALKENGYVDVLCSKSTIAHFTAEKLASVPAPYPSQSEQTTIAAFLDHQTGQIDALIEEQRRLIELLKEKRQAVISHAVTKGLNPNVPMKDSGVEWLGEVPAHWGVTRIKYARKSWAGSLRPGPFGSHIKGSDFVESSVWRVYNQATVISGDFEKSAFITEKKFQELSSFSVESGDILVTSRGTIGRVAVAPSTVEPGIIHPCLIRLRINLNKVRPEFLKIIFEGTGIAIEQLRLSSNATTIDVVYAESLANTCIAMPPICEQIEIVQYVDRMVGHIDRATSDGESLIGYLQERRSALISAAVTGKIDVRGWSAGAEAEEPGLAMVAEESAGYSAQGGAE